MSLNKGQNSELVRGVTLEAFLAVPKNNLIYKDYLPFNRTRLNFGMNVDKLNNYAKDKEKTVAGTVTKSELKRDIAKRLAIDLKLTKDYAIFIKDTKLKVLVNYSETTINDMKDADILPFVSNLSEKVFTTALLTNIVFMTYDIDTTDIAGIVADANKFNEMIGGNKKDENESSSANDAMDLVIEDIHSNVESFNNTIDYFADTHPEFVSGYHKNKVKSITGIRHEGLQGIVRRNGVVQAGATVRLVGAEKSINTDGSGHYEMYLRPGNCTIEVSVNGLFKQTRLIEVLYRQIIEIDFDLV